jgi:acyl carrier protein
MTSVKDQVISIISEKGAVDKSLLHPEAKIEQLGIDSLGMVESIFAIEEAFGVSVPFNANQPGEGGFDISSVGSIITSVEALIAART